MPFIGERLGLTTAVKNAGTTALLNVDFVKGAFKVYVSSDLVGISPNLFSDNQIIYVQDSGSLYKADVVPADFISTFEDTVSFAEFSFNSGSFTSASFDGTATLTLFGQNLQGSDQISMSVDLSALTGSGGGGGGIPPPPPPEPVSADKSTDIDIWSEPCKFCPNNVSVAVPSKDALVNEPLLNENSAKDTVSSNVEMKSAGTTSALYNEPLS